MERIIWQQTGSDPNDLKAIVPLGMLRVERMDRNHWWFCVSFDEDIQGNGVSLADAKRKCTLKYKQLLK